MLCGVQHEIPKDSASPCLPGTDRSDRRRLLGDRILSDLSLQIQRDLRHRPQSDRCRSVAGPMPMRLLHCCASPHPCQPSPVTLIRLPGFRVRLPDSRRPAWPNCHKYWNSRVLAQEQRAFRGRLSHRGPIPAPLLGFPTLQGLTALTLQRISPPLPSRSCRAAQAVLEPQGFHRSRLRRCFLVGRTRFSPFGLVGCCLTLGFLTLLP